MNIQIDTEKKYDVIVENGALDRVGALVQPVIKNGAQAMIVSDTNVFPIYGERLIKSLSTAGFKASCFVFEAGEAQKQISTAMQIYEALAEKNFACTDFIVTLGGGVAGDLGGFAAATFLKGLDYVQVPTSLLAQVDISLTGESGLNMPFGRNIVGAVHQPKLVVCDPETLSTLPDEYFMDGMGEVIKYGCIQDEELFDRLECGEVIDHMEETVSRCIACKQALAEVGEDVILGFGHTFGEALEKMDASSALSHGLAVGIGMVMAAEVGESFGVTEIGTASRIRSVLESYDIPFETQLDFSKVVETTARDKRNPGKQLQLVLLKKIGETVLHPIDRSYLVLRYKIAAEQYRRKQ